ncbi:branched-chain amino acid ABC transporter permease [Caldimicrobium thiodismutans]|jgi:branched-chain amino acid transport system permease protein|uniref:Branched-chain amino acid ABC transporter permease n=1 Tax=Caldimicrobium thiodismutans TaxID=1653476 RepID=A0A0U5AWR5_9BACT|nr:branched-chain amino acid ABC transporter permease [Caldimicrobium thiodismutans]BAU23832.1 branched-chain amino acid ABC transporter permease [Caldimicrobium thiodismutans]
MKKLLFNSYSGSLFFCLLLLFAGFLFKDPYLNTVLVMAGLNALSALGLSLLMGLAGQISLGHNGFYGLGAYFSAILTLKYNIPVPLSIIISASLSALFSIFLALPALRLKGHYLAVATLAFGEIIYLLLNEWGPGGPSGFGDIPKLNFGSYTLESPLAYLIFIWLLFWVFFLFSQNLTTSTYGRTLKALHSSEIALKTLGVNLLSLKIKIFMLSAFYTALSGGIYAHFVTFLSPANFSIFYSILILMMVMIGGMHSLWGALLGALFITLLPEVLRPFKEYDVLLYGLVLTFGLLFFREGLVGTIKGWFQKWLIS